ncbi:MAG: hypothetical protein HZB68_00455 [Candidatus Aenigmarchaeota archaeon]|nr:hypothetical protein [Candidatus Aenigmarchaeota archaeon]
MISMHRCDCKNPLEITGEIKEEGWRTGFRLECKKCGKKFDYTGGRLKKAI